jgi:hypothetical protein
VVNGNPRPKGEAGGQGWSSGSAPKWWSSWGYTINLAVSRIFLKVKMRWSVINALYIFEQDKEEKNG